MTKCKFLVQLISVKLLTPDNLVPCPITIVKIPSWLDTTLKLSEKTLLPFVVFSKIFTIAYIFLLLAALLLASLATAWKRIPFGITTCENK